MSDPTDTPTAPPAADNLAALEARAAGLDATAAPPDPNAPPAGMPAVSTADELRGVLEMARLMIAPAMGWWPDFAQVWSDQTVERIAAAGGEVMDRHGWQMGEVLSKWGPYVALIAASVPPGLATWQAIKWRQAEIERAARNAGQRPQMPPEAAPA